MPRIFCFLKQKFLPTSARFRSAGNPSALNVFVDQKFQNSIMVLRKKMFFFYIFFLMFGNKNLDILGGWKILSVKREYIQSVFVDTKLLFFFRCLFEILDQLICLLIFFVLMPVYLLWNSNFIFFKQLFASFCKVYFFFGCNCKKSFYFSIHSQD